MLEVLLAALRGSDQSDWFTGTELLSSSVPRSPSLPACTSKLFRFTEIRKMARDGAEVSLTPKRDRRPCTPLCSCPGSLRERLKGARLSWIQAPSYLVPWREGTSRFSVWAGLTGGKGNEYDLWAGLFGPIQCPLVVVSLSYRTVGSDLL